MDVLSDILSHLRVSSTLSARMEAGSDWAISFVVRDAAKLCCLGEGACWLLPEGGDPIRLLAGDFFMACAGARYVLTDQKGLEATSAAVVFGGEGRAAADPVRIGSGTTTKTFHGILEFDRSDGAFFLNLLPPFLVVRRQEAEDAGVAVYLDRLISEATDPSPGAAVVANWLGGILFVHAVRNHARQSADNGWLGALADPHIALALEAMHLRVNDSWTVDSLAREAGLSRSGFAARFRDLVGRPPLEYLTQWRVQKAGQLLRRGSLSPAEVAQQVGYESETAFAKVFKRQTGVTPAQVRGRGASPSKLKNAAPIHPTTPPATAP